MALPHSEPLDVISVRPLGPQLRQAVSTSLLRTDRLQLLHLVLPIHEVVPQHWVNETCVLQCLEGRVEVALPDGVRRLNAGELVVLPPAQAHSLRAHADAAVLMTLLHHGETDATGGPGAPPAG